MSFLVSNRLRRFSEKYITPIAKFVDRLHFTPNTCTIIGLIMAIFSGVSIIIAGLPQFAAPLFQWFFLLCASLLLLASGFFDMLDGVLARYQNSSSVFGGYLDSVLDRYSDAIIIIAAIIAGFCNLYFGLIALIGCILVSYSRARAESAGVESKYMAAGIAERMERLVIMGFCLYAQQGYFLLVILGLAPVPVALPGLLPFFFPNMIGTGILILAIITHATVVHRIYIAYTRLPKEKLDAASYDKEKERIQKELQEKKEQES